MRRKNATIHQAEDTSVGRIVALSQIDKLDYQIQVSVAYLNGCTYVQYREIG